MGSQLTEARVRAIITEEILREDVSLVVESTDLFEASAAEKTKAAAFVGDAALELLQTADGRKILAGALRLPLILTKYFDKAMGAIPKKIASTAGFKQGGIIHGLINKMAWLQSAPLKAAAIPMAKAAGWIEDMDDSMANFLIDGIMGENPEAAITQDEPDSTDQKEKTPSQGGLRRGRANRARRRAKFQKGA